MLQILLLTNRREAMDCFADTVSSDPGVTLERVSSVSEALDILRTRSPHLAVIDGELPDLEWVDVVREMVAVNAMVNTAVTSPLNDVDFHEKTEGLGILCRLPPEPDDKDAGSLLRKLREVLGMM